MLQLRNPGWPTIVMFAAAAILLSVLVHGGTALPEAVKTVVEILGIAATAGAAFVGKSAIVVDISKRKSSAPPPAKNPNLITWPDMPAAKVPEIPVIHEGEDEPTKTEKEGGGK